MAFRRSLIGRMITVALLATVAIVAAVSWIVFQVTFAETRADKIEQLEARTLARADGQMNTFLSLNAHLEQSRAVYQRIRTTITPEVARSRLDSAFPGYGDGTRRSRDALFDGDIDEHGVFVRGIGAFLPRADEIEGDRLVEVASGYNVVAQMGPSLLGQLTSFWFYTNYGDVIVFAPDRPDRLRPYRRDLPADFDFSDQEVAQLGSHTAAPDRGMRCGSLAPLVYDDTGGEKILTASCQIPVDDADGRHIGSFGTTLPVTGWMNETVRTSKDADFRYMIVSRSSGLLAHGQLESGSAAHVAMMEKAEHVDEITSRLAGANGTFDLENFDAAVAYARIDGPGWYLVALQPSRVVTAAATAAAIRAALAMGITALCLIITLGFFFFKLVAQPLKKLADEAERDIQESSRLGRLAQGDDEVCRLAAALVKRDKRAQSLVETLEQRVGERTEQLDRARIAAEAANDAKTSFLATMSHEIRTPMNGVVGMADALARTDLSDEQREFLSVMSRSGEALLALIDDILDISKIEAGKLKIEPLPVDPREVIDEVCGLYAETADRKGIVLLKDIAEIKLEQIVTDPLRLRQILSNLVSNALKFTSEGFVKVIAAQEAPETLQIQVVDTGPGIPLDLQGAIFNKFEQAENSTTRRFGGTGLGLAISRELAHLLGGDLRVKSHPGEGATFTLTIRELAQTGTSSFDLGRADPQLLQAGADDALRGIQVLVAEDLAVNRQVLSAICKPLGIKLTMAENGAEAIELLKEGFFDAVLMDLRMPVMDGLEATRRIRAGEAGDVVRDLPIIALTANAMREHVEESLAAGADLHVSKPVGRQALVAALHACLVDSAHSPREETQSTG